MQHLLGRISELDPNASQALRVIACFDELSVGGVNTRGLLAAAAALSGSVAGFRSDLTGRSMRVTPRGDLMPGDPPADITVAPASSGLTVWLERDANTSVNDAIILERLALSVRLRNARGPRDIDGRRHLNLLLDREVDIEERRMAAASLGLTHGGSYRIAAAPLFAIWTEHPAAPEDVVATSFGPMHALVLSADVDNLQAGPCGIGVATGVDHLDHSFRTALVALRLCDPPREPVVNADTYAGLVDLLADTPINAHQPDVELVDRVSERPWGLPTLDVVVRSTSARHAARLARVHHSTMQTRVDALAADLGFDPFEGYGRVRAGIAYLTWRLQRSRVLELPAPARPNAQRA